mmetsp:Transcript_37657/g.86949  ORF Transcript_37657/g.86949 Transcript_37657/m.86949 type:complete len:80 (-) Transcript_37657:8-247(-)
MLTRLGLDATPRSGAEVFPNAPGVPTKVEVKTGKPAYKRVMARTAAKRALLLRRAIAILLRAQFSTGIQDYLHCCATRS